MKQGFAIFAAGIVLLLIGLAWFLKTLGGGGGEVPMAMMVLGGVLTLVGLVLICMKLVSKVRQKAS